MDRFADWKSSKFTFATIAGECSPEFLGSLGGETGNGQRENRNETATCPQSDAETHTKIVQKNKNKLTEHVFQSHLLRCLLLLDQ